MHKIGAIILAAGMSKRMRQPKLLLPLYGKPLFRYPLELAIRNKLDPIVFIAGQHMEKFQAGTTDLQGIEMIRNPNFAMGMSTSLGMGIEQLRERTTATFIFLADQPFVPDLVIQTMIEHFEEELSSGGKIIRPQYQGSPGHPILIHKSLYREFLQLDGDKGGKEIIKKYKEETKVISFDSFIWGMDIDTVEEYEKSKQFLLESGEYQGL